MHYDQPEGWRAAIEPFLDSVIRSVSLIKREIYGGDEELATTGATPLRPAHRVGAPPSGHQCAQECDKCDEGGQEE